MDGPCAGAACGGGCWYCGGGCWYCGCCCCASRSARRWFCSSSAYCASSARRPMCRPAAYAPPPTTAARSNGRRRLIMTCLLRRCTGLDGLFPGYFPVYPLGQGKAESHHEFRRGGDGPRPADLRRDRLQHAEQVRRRAAGPERVGHLPQIGGRRRVERDQGGDLDERESARVQAARLLPFGPGLQARQQQVRVAQG